LKNILVTACLTPLLLLLSGCFTGVESTPKITYKEAKNKKAEDSSKEESLAKSFAPQKFSEWKPGKRLFVTSDRIGLIVTPDDPSDTPLCPGDILVYRGNRNVTDLTGGEIVEVILESDGNPERKFSYRTNTSPESLAGRDTFDVPFTIDLDLVDKVKEALAGQRLYVKTALWHDATGKAVNGLKFIPVTITDVLPANEIYPFMVLFTDGNGRENAMLMSASSGLRWMPREFQSLFSFEDPHKNYPAITDAVWNNIIHSRVSKGMTKTEATLALGNPRSIDRGHSQSSAYERWSYSDGVYLIFEDGLLEGFNK